MSALARSFGFTRAACGPRTAATLGLAAMASDVAATTVARHAGAPDAVAQLAGFAACFVAVHVLALRHQALPPSRAPLPAVSAATLPLTRGVFGLLWILALFMRGGVSASIEGAPRLPEPVADIVAAAFTFLAIAVGAAFLCHPRRWTADAGVAAWCESAVLLSSALLLLRLAFAGSIELIPEEAYYWTYAAHLDIGYLDHPPMVAWLIALGTAAFGTGEFGVRAGAILCSGVTVAAVATLTRRRHGSAAAVASVFLQSVIPAYFGFGFLMTPDAPVIACWSVALLFAHRALLEGSRKAWLGLGAAVGIGLLSKYTIALLAPAILLFCLLDRGSRRWLRSPWPLAAALLAALLFLPVIVWNIRHDFASFVFQGPRRFAGSDGFGTPALAVFVLVLLTPLGVAGVIRELRRGSGGDGCDPEGRRQRLFVRVMILVPFAVFLLHSLDHGPRLDWTAPLWLAALPGLGRRLADRVACLARGGRASILDGAWRLTGVFVLVTAGVTALDLTGHIPGTEERPWLRAATGWESLADRVAVIERDLGSSAGAPPVVVGLDRYMISSELAFYRSLKEGGGEGVAEAVDRTAGRHLLGRGALMWRYWAKPGDLAGRDAVLVSDGRRDIENPCLRSRFESLGPVEVFETSHRGRAAGRFYIRAGRGYRPPEPALR